MGPKQTDDLLVELYSEEIPASYQQAAIRSTEKPLRDALQAALLSFEKVTVTGTNRRLVLLVEGLAGQQDEKEEELKGPPRKICFNDQGESTQALAGFAKKAGTEPALVEFKTFGKDEYAFALRKTGGQGLEEVIFPVLEELFFSIKFPRSMRWGDGDMVYARPLLSLYIQHGNRHLKPAAGYDGLLKELPLVEKVQGHFAYNQQHIEISSAGDYFEKLRQHHIVVDHNERRKLIAEGLEKEAAATGCQVVLDQALLNEVNFLLEVPRVVLASFDQEYLELPDIVIISEMQEHQKYFALKKGGELSSQFLVVMNGHNDSETTRKNVSVGNAKVLRARLSDGAFFYHEDRKRSLADRVADLKNVVFQQGMGSVFDKKERLKKIAHQFLSQSDLSVPASEEEINRACDLLKADLTTQLVFEFEHLQGEIGRLYALADGENPAVAQAIFEHYLPRNQADDKPASALGALLSIAEKLDNILAGFLLDRAPTASTDPLGLRRQALYLIEIIIENQVHVQLDSLVSSLWSFYPGKMVNSRDDNHILKLTAQVREFFTIRLATIFEKQGFDRKMVRAALFTGGSDIYDYYLKLSALKDLQNDENFVALMAAFKRMSNILDDYREKNKVESLPTSINEELFENDQERALHGVVLGLRQELEKSLMFQEQYEDLFKKLAASKPAIDAFFDNVMVMHDDEKIRINRIALLQSVVQPIKKLLDLRELK